MEETKSYPRFTFGKILSIHHDELFYKLVKANSETLDYSIQLLINSLLHRNFFGFFSFHQISLPIFVLFKILHTRCITFNVDSATSLLHNPQPIFFPMPTRYTFTYRPLQSKNIPRMHQCTSLLPHTIAHLQVKQFFWLLSIPSTTFHVEKFPLNGGPRYLSLE